MIRLAHIKVECCDCRRDSPTLYNLQVLEFVRDLQDLYGWTMVEKYGDHYMRCNLCTADIDRVQEESLGPY